MGKIKIDNNDNIDTDSSSNNISPPSYEVEELRDGSLYNRELNVSSLQSIIAISNF